MIEPDNSQQMEHKKWCACALASRQVSVPALSFLIKLDGIVERMVEWWLQGVNSLHSRKVCGSLMEL